VRWHPSVVTLLVLPSCCVRGDGSSSSLPGTFMSFDALRLPPVHPSAIAERISGGHGHALPVDEPEPTTVGTVPSAGSSDVDVEAGGVGRSTSLSLTTTQPQPTVVSGASSFVAPSLPPLTTSTLPTSATLSFSHATASSTPPVAAVGGGGSESNSSRKSRTAMVGLVVHAAVDGVALGSAVANGDSTLGMIVFVAIMLHKAPSSFGLASYLLHNGMSRARVQRRLFIFSLAAPLGAIGTYALLSLHLFVYTMVSVPCDTVDVAATGHSTPPPSMYAEHAIAVPAVQRGHFPAGGDCAHPARGGGWPRTQPRSPACVIHWWSRGPRQWQRAKRIWRNAPKRR